MARVFGQIAGIVKYIIDSRKWEPQMREEAFVDRLGREGISLNDLNKYFDAHGFPCRFPLVFENHDGMEEHLSRRMNEFMRDKENDSLHYVERKRKLIDHLGKSAAEYW
jgi:hypothetical protein